MIPRILALILGFYCTGCQHSESLAFQPTPPIAIVEKNLLPSSTPQPTHEFMVDFPVNTFQIADIKTLPQLLAHLKHITPSTNITLSGHSHDPNESKAALLATARVQTCYRLLRLAGYQNNIHQRALWGETDLSSCQHCVTLTFTN